ncbi:MAG: PilZ domain-containing protein [Porticoccus sp.]|nr:PilZ domain-containing protein [Porticoccus sp.]MBQ0806644.1 PilZ domain-containing protein [Porticoccus sp.]
MPSELNRRGLTRHKLGAQVEVVNQITGVTLGVLVDIHLEGFMLMGSEQLKSEHLYQIKLRVDGLDGSLDEGIELGIDCLWARAMAQEDRFWAGCRIIDVSPDAREKLVQLISEFTGSVSETSGVSP